MKGLGVVEGFLVGSATVDFFGDGSQEQLRECTKYLEYIVPYTEFVYSNFRDYQNALT